VFQFSNFNYKLTMNSKCRFNCDSCGRTYSRKSNLNWHVAARHVDEVLYYRCVLTDCKCKFIRKSSVKKHLSNKHNIDKVRAYELVSELVLSTVKSDTYNNSSQPVKADINNNCTQSRTPLNTNAYEDISSDELVNSTTTESAYELVSDGEFEAWLDDISQPQSTGSPPLQCSDITDDEQRIDAIPSPTTDDITLEEVYSRAAMECDRSSESSESVNTNDVVNDAKDTGKTDIVVIHDTDDTMSDVDIDATIPDFNPDVTENVEFINLTFKTTTRFVNGELSTVNRTASVAYSDMFNP